MAQSSATISQTRDKGYAPLRFRAGEDVTIALEINTSSGNESLTGDDLHWSMRRVGSLRNALNKSVGDGITVTSEANGTANVSVTSDNTKKLEPGTYVHQLWIEDSSGDYETIYLGLIRLQPQIILGEQSQVLENV